jgi:hypothetical protein
MIARLPVGFGTLSLACAALFGSLAAAGTPARVDAIRSAQRSSQQPSATSAARPCVSQERDAAFQILGSVASVCGGMRTANPDGRTSWMFPSACLFRDEGGAVPGANSAVFRAIVAEMRAHSSRRYSVIVYARGNAGSSSVTTTRTRADSLVTRLVAAGLDRARFDARGAGTTVAEETYDGPSTLAPGNALIEIALLRAPGDATNCPP